jgi:predicted acylesterase/phospholipase RssA
VNCSIWQAARATSAAPLFFDPITFGVPPKTYGDGGLHYNNPIRILLDESKRIWNCETERRAGMIISIGTGKPKLRGFGKSLTEIVKSLQAIVTNTQETEEMFANEIADLASTERPHYFRFNVDQGLEDIGLEEWGEFETLTEATDAYLKTHRRYVDSCVEAFLSLIGEPRAT